MEDLLIKYVMGEATAEEAAQVERWLEADAANRRLYEQYRNLRALSSRTAARESAAPRGGDGVARVKRVRVRWPAWMRVAAAVIGLFVLGAGGYWLVNKGAQSSQGGVAKSPAGPTRQSGVEVPPTVVSRNPLMAGAHPRTDTLPDGTMVTLNRGAALTIVGGSVEKGLTVRLRGEGFFSVRHDPVRAFVVQVGAVAIKVLGTSFELNGDGNDSLELAVETGAVRVGDQIIVHAGERMTITAKGRWRIGPIRDKLYGYYLGRPLVCDSTPLRQLVEVLNRAAYTPIVLGRKELGDLPLTTEFRGKSPERILEVVALTFNLSIVRRGSEIILQ